LIDIALVLDTDVYIQTIANITTGQGEQSLGVIDITAKQIDTVPDNATRAGIHLKAADTGNAGAGHRPAFKAVTEKFYIR
jgi:hypothetical protein